MRKPANAPEEESLMKRPTAPQTTRMEHQDTATTSEQKLQKEGTKTTEAPVSII